MMIEAILPDEAPLNDPSARPRERRRMASAILASGLVHAAIIALLIGLWAPIPEPPPLLPIPVTLHEGNGAAGAIGGGSGETAASASSAASESTTPKPAAAPAPQPTETVAPQQAEAPTVAPPTKAPPTPTETLAATTNAAAEPVPRRKPEPPHPPQAAAPVQAPAPPQQAAAPPAPTGPATAAPSASSTASASADAPPESGVGGRGRGEEGRGRAAYGNGSLDSPGDDYLDQLQRWIARFRTYPDEAKTKKEEGTVSIGFEIARDGTVLDAWIAQSSGFPLLDAAALKMIRDASPVPKVPATYPGETLRFKAMPEQFRIGTFDRLFH